MPVSANHHQTLDIETKQTLESSLAMQMIKLFAIVARADEIVTDKETVYVSSFLEKFYPENISRYLYNRFEEYISKDQDYHEVVRSINAKLSYQEPFAGLLVQQSLRKLKLTWLITLPSCCIYNLQTLIS